jgi:hypothetical protein
MELKDLLSDSGKSIAVTDYRYLPKNQILADSDILRIHVKLKKYRYRNLISQVLRDGQFCIDVGRLSGKSKNGDFSNFALNDINNLQTPKSQI